MAQINGEQLLKRLPVARGRLEPNAMLSDLTWFRVGGPAEVLFSPADESDLSLFLKATPRDIAVYVIGVGSNLLVRDGGVPGVVIRLGRGFASLSLEAGDRIRAGAAALDVRVARFAQEHGIDALTFLRGTGHDRRCAAHERGSLWWGNQGHPGRSACSRPVRKHPRAVQ